MSIMDRAAKTSAFLKIAKILRYFAEFLDFFAPSKSPGAMPSTEGTKGKATAGISANSVIH